MKFRSGDVVRLIDSEDNLSVGYLKRLVGKAFKVISPVPSGHHYLSAEGVEPGWLASRFELASKKSSVRIQPKSAVNEINLNAGVYVVMLREKGAYLPSTEPKVYFTERQALHVAKAMSKKHGGTFVTFKAIGEAELPQLEPTVRKYA